MTMKRYPQTLTAFALCLAVALTAGCASSPKKPAAEEVPADTAGQADTARDTTAGAGQDDGRVGTLNGGNAVNSRNLPDAAGRGSGTTDGTAAESGDGRGKGGGSGDGDGSVSALSDRTVNFEFDSADILQDDYPTLLAHARYLQQNPQARVLLAGHADERGTREYNMALGERRAKAVEAFLGVNGVKSSQLDTVSYGKEKPLNDGHDEAAWAENRRVEIGYESGAPRD